MKLSHPAFRFSTQSPEEFCGQLAAAIPKARSMGVLGANFEAHMQMAMLPRINICQLRIDDTRIIHPLEIPSVGINIPLAEPITYRVDSKKLQAGVTFYRYWSSNCRSCSLKSRCTTGKERRVSRWEYEAVLEAMQDRLDRHPEKMRIRRDTVEHPFGTLKRWMGSEHFLTRTFEHVSTEMSLHVLAYNLKRVMNRVGIEALIGAIRPFLSS